MSREQILERVRRQIDRDFPVKPKVIGETPITTEPTAVFCERYTTYNGEPREWLRILPAPVEDTQIVAFSRVSRSLDYQGTRLYRTPPKPIPDGVDADVYVQNYVDECGLAAEAYNASGQTVKKYTTQSETLNFL